MVYVFIKVAFDWVQPQILFKLNFTNITHIQRLRGILLYLEGTIFLSYGLIFEGVSYLEVIKLHVRLFDYSGFRYQGFVQKNIRWLRNMDWWFGALAYILTFQFDNLYGSIFELLLDSVTQSRIYPLNRFVFLLF